MKITDITLEIRTEDGQSHLVVFDRWDFNPDGAVVLAGQLVREKWRAIFGESGQLQDGQIRSVMDCSALVRFYHEDAMRTGAITHITNRAFRIINNDLGVTWIPKHILRWSRVAEQFVVVDETYKMDFTTEVAKGMDAYPIDFEINEELINQLEEEPSNVDNTEQ
jgi:hypothetical protein